MKLQKFLSLSGITTTLAATAFLAPLSGCVSPLKDLTLQNEVETNANSALSDFNREAANAPQIVQEAQGVLVCPKMTKGGFMVGVEGGTCVMRINGITTEYYRASSVKFGMLAGIESFALLLVFNSADTLAIFREGNKQWQVGGNLSLSVAKKGIGGGFDTMTIGAPVTAYVFSQVGLMGDLSLDGATFNKFEQ